MSSRLYPKKNSGRYHILVQLRKSIEEIISSNITFTKETKLFDYGCGERPYEPIWRKYVSEYVGADFSNNELAEIIIHENGDILGINDLENTFDIVFSSQVLEHVQDVESYLNKASRILKKDGTLILSTHGVWEYHPHPSDFWRWTKEGLYEEFKKADKLKIEKIISVMGMTATGLQLFQDGFVKRVPNRFKKTFFRTIQILQSWLDDYDKNSNNASVFIVIAKKLR